MTVADTVPLTGTVRIENVAVIAPAGTVTLAGTVRGSDAVNETDAPPTGAAPLRPTVAINV